MRSNEPERGHVFMNIREMREAWEADYLSPYASLSRNTKGRERGEIPCDIRTAYQRDRDRILHCKSFRRLKHKTQVFLAPEGDHYRTRLTHTLEVSQIARTIARGLRLNEDLTEAISLGHDLGHTPFGHTGESALAGCLARHKGIDPASPGAEALYRHNEQSLRVVERIENGGRGLNLTPEVRDGIVNHTGDLRAETLEGRIVAVADRIAYVNHDIDDAMRAGILTNDDIPREISDVLGETHRERINTLVTDMIFHSRGTGELGMTPEIEQTMQALRQFMFEHVYKNPVAKGEESKARRILQELYTYYIAHPEALPQDFQPQLTFEGLPRVVCDYIAGMTDKYLSLIHI